MKVLYIISIVISTVFLMVIYFTNIIFMGNYQMFLGSTDNRISVALGLALIMIASGILGASIILLLKSLGTKRPKDFDDFDL